MMKDHKNLDDVLKHYGVKGMKWRDKAEREADDIEEAKKLADKINESDKPKNPDFDPLDKDAWKSLWKELGVAKSVKQLDKDLGVSKGIKDAKKSISKSWDELATDIGIKPTKKEKAKKTVDKTIKKTKKTVNKKVKATKKQVDNILKSFK